MTTQHTVNTFTATGWDEKVIAGDENAPRFAHAHATFDYSGVIEGTGTCDYLLYYSGAGYDGGGTTSPGLERIEGKIDGRSGSFLIRHEVGFDLHGIQGKWHVLEGSGTGDLAGISGNGTVAGGTNDNGAMSYTFDFRF